MIVPNQTRTARLLQLPETIGLYREILHRHLVDRPAGEIDFFVNPRRFNLLRGLVGNQLDGKTILNAASGPFAFELFVAPTGARIESFDIDPLLPAVHQELLERGLIAPSSTFKIADIMGFEPSGQYDVVLINDLFFIKFVDFFAALPRYAKMLAPRGLLYFDILDVSAAPIWNLLHNDPRYRRYRMDEVRAALVQNGFEILEMLPSPGIKGGLDEVARRGMWAVARIANNFAFLARKQN